MTAQATQRPAVSPGSHEWFEQLRADLRPAATLRECQTWESLQAVERKAVLRMAGLSATVGRFGGQGSTPVTFYARQDWADLPESVRARVRCISQRLAGLLGRFQLEKKPHESTT